MDLGKMTDEQLIELLREGKTEITDYLMGKIQRHGTQTSACHVSVGRRK